VFTGFSDVGQSFSDAFVSGTAGGSPPRTTNAWYNPLATKTAPYSAGLVVGTTRYARPEERPSLCRHAELPSDLEGCVWSETYLTSEVLRPISGDVRPGAGSRSRTRLTRRTAPDGHRAIGSGAPDGNDRFGLTIR